MSERTVHRWVDRDGRAWRCDAYDHGPFCRLCERDPANDRTVVYDEAGTITPEQFDACVRLGREHGPISTTWISTDPEVRRGDD